MPKFKTDAFARIKCEECHEVVATLMPGQPFNSIPDCKCKKGAITSYEDMDIEDVRALLKHKNIPFTMNSKKETLIKKLKEV